MTPSRPLRTCRFDASIVDAAASILGYRPSESLVFLIFEGRHSGACMRFDLPPERGARGWSVDVTEQFAEQALQLVMRVENATGIAAVVFVDRAVRRAPHADLVDTLNRVAHRHGVDVHFPSYRAENGWGQYDLEKSGRSTRPKPLRQLEETGNWSATNTASVDLSPGPGGPASDEGAPRLTHPLEGPAAIEVVLDGRVDCLHPDDLAALHTSIANQLSSPASRDLLLAHIAFGPDDVPDLTDVAIELFGGGAPQREPSADARENVSLRHRFAYERCVAAIDLLRAVARSLPAEQRAGAYASLSWLTWAIGQSTPAMSWAERAGTLDETIIMPGAVHVLVTYGVVPPWFGVAPVSVRQAWEEHRPSPLFNEPASGPRRSRRRASDAA